MGPLWKPVPALCDMREYTAMLDHLSDSAKGGG